MAVLGFSRDGRPPLRHHDAARAAARRAARRRSPRCSTRGRYILGPGGRRVRARARRATSARRHVVGVANGTDALVLALRALGVGPGDDVVVPSFTFYASAEAIALIGANPVFCDVDPRTFCVTPETVRAALTPRDEGRDGRAPVRQRRAGRGDRGARRAGARGRGAGARLAHGRRPPRRRAGRRGDVLVLPVEEPRRVRRRRGRRDRRRRRSPSACGCCASTARATR